MLDAIAKRNRQVLAKAVASRAVAAKEAAPAPDSSMKTVIWEILARFTTKQNVDRI